MPVAEHRQVPSLLADARSAYMAGDLPRAEMLYRKVLQVKKNQVEALGMLGLVTAQQGGLQDGLNLIDKAIALEPTLARLYFFRGNVLEHLKRYEEALDSYRAVERAEPNYPPLYLSRGISESALGLHDAAIASFTRAIILNPGYTEAYFNRGNSWQKLRRFEDAARDYRRATELTPDFAPLHNNLGVALKELKQYGEACECFRKAITLDPGYYHALNNLGTALCALHRDEEALAVYERVLALQPGYAEVYSNRARSLLKLRRFDEALASYDRSIALSPGYLDALNNKAFALYEMRRFDESRALYDKALAQMPDYYDAQWNKSLLLLIQGEFEEGWKLFEARWKKSDIHANRAFAAPLWLGGEPVSGKTILLHAEQGLGDTLQFCRYVTLVEALGARVVFEVQKPLVGICATLKTNARIFAQGETLPAQDYHCPLLSLPHALGTTLNTLPAEVPYLFAGDTKQRAWEGKLGAKRGLRVGVIWRGNPEHKNDYNRSIPLAVFAPVFAARGKEFHALQKDVSQEDAAMLAAHGVATHAEDLGDFTDTAALIACMDMVISVDTAVAHLTGAMARKLWLLLPFAGDFRWLVDRTDSPWYPTARIFQQCEKRIWADVIEQVIRELRNEFG